MLLLSLLQVPPDILSVIGDVPLSAALCTFSLQPPPMQLLVPYIHTPFLPLCLRFVFSATWPYRNGTPVIILRPSDLLAAITVPARAFASEKEVPESSAICRGAGQSINND